MPQCKISGCREQAQPHGKRLCPEHAKRRDEKRKVYFAKPQCVFCRTQHTDLTNDAGVPECSTCRNERGIREEQSAAKTHIIEELMSCADIHQLKTFIIQHLLKD